MSAVKKTAGLLEKHIGEKVVMICARYQYWGILSEVNERTLVLAKAVAVESSGSAQGEAPQDIDNIGTSIIIMLDAVECLYWPKWVNNTLPSEE